MGKARINVETSISERVDIPSLNDLPGDVTHRITPTPHSLSLVSHKQSSNMMIFSLRLFLVLVLAALSRNTATATAAVCANEEAKDVTIPMLMDATIEDLSSGLAQGAFSSGDLVKAYFARISQVNDALRPVLEMNPDALSDASILDQERSQGKIRGALHGIPILIKDLIGTGDKMNNTAGSYALLGARVPRDATVVSKLREAGAIILGKTAVSEWANLRSLNSSNGWSARSGQVTTAYVAQGDPSGSSSGSAVAAALGLSLGALGTETDGSLVLPASYNNIVAIKPTVGLTSRYMAIPISPRSDTIGPMTRTVKDAAYILQAIAGLDPNDNYTSAIPHKEIQDYIAACNASSLFGSRIGVPRHVLTLLATNTTVPMTNAFENALDHLRAHGATIVETSFPLAEEFLASSLSSTVIFADFISSLPTYFSQLSPNPHDIQSLSDLRNFTQNDEREQYPDRDTGLWDLALQQGWNNSDPRFWTAYQRVLTFGSEGGILGALERDGLDAVVLPSEFAPHWAAIVGSPIVSVPLGAYPDGTPIEKNSRGLVVAGPGVPFGLSFMGALWSETTLIGLAYAFEQISMARGVVKPYISPSIEIEDVVGRGRSL